MKLVKTICLIYIGLNCSVMAQKSEFRKIQGLDESIGFKEILHASMAFKINDKIIYVDPWGEIERYKDLPKADLILITDIHQDHYSESTIEAVLSDKGLLVVPEAVFSMMPATWQARSKVIGNGQKLKLEDLSLEIEAIPMYNTTEGKESFHEKGRGNGYLIKSNGSLIYVSGDTEDIPEMRALKGVDVAFVCMNQPYTMSVDQAAAAVIAFKPGVVYPYHYRNSDKSLSDVEHFSELVKKAGVKCELLDWYAEIQP